MEKNYVTKQVKSIEFSLISPENIKKIGVAKIVTPELYDMDGYPVDGGLMDLRLGAIDPGVRCRTCGGKLKECLGHFGFIEMARPIIHVKYVALMEMLLRSTCYECGRILVSEEDLKLKSPAEIIKKAKDAKKCPYCKKEHEKVKLEKPTTFQIGKKRAFPNEIRAILTKISDNDLRYFGINPTTCRPEWAVLTLLLVPPVTVRPSITLETGERSEDDLTHKLGDIVRSNQRLWENLNAGAPEVIIEDLWDLLQYHVTTFFDNSIAQVPPARHRSGQPLETITERIKGKEGRIRHNLAGKRVNFSSRSVISPDPYMRLNEVGIPMEIAKILTVPEKVTSENIERLKKLIETGEKWPGANYVVRPDGKKKRITEELKQELMDEIAIGYVVERHLVDGDIVLFNRHPSLHKASLMGHFAKILDGKTFRLHPGATYPYNADFDGDEMNIHVPQTEEAKAESKIILGLNQQLISPKNNTNLFGCITDAITGNYLLSLAELSRKDAVQILTEVGVDTEKLEKLKGSKISGREIFSMLLPKINFETKTRLCKGKDCPNFEKCLKSRCPHSAFLSIENGKMISGVMDNNVIGVEDGILIKELDKQTKREITMDILNKLFRLGVLYLSKVGFTITLDDVNMPTIQASSQTIIKESEKKANEYVDAYYNNTLELIPGKSRKESREMKILHTLNDVRSKLGEIVKKEIPKENPANIMITSGAGGNILYITQMACSVGQQSLWAKRIEIGYENRTLPFFKQDDLSPLAHGFIESSYFNGLKPYEFFFGAMTGRDALMDTALRTPKSGYLYRRLANSLQDLKVEYDSTVRDATGRIVQFAYGDDGVDVSRLHMHDKMISPGEAIGIVTAQSFGEPSTQMALNVFHFAGVSEMQITLGLPRLIEIFDARKKPSTPSMEIFLEEEYNNDEKAKEIAEKIKSITLQDVANQINVLFTEGKIEIKLDRNAMKELHTGPATVLKNMIAKGIKAKLKDDATLVVHAGESANFKEIYMLKERLKETLVGGIKGISQILIVKRDNKYKIITAGSNLEEVMKTKGVDKEKVMTNDIHEIAAILGIESSRQAVINEIEKVINQQGLDIDKRHIKLVADAMTSSGEVKGITRIGIIAEKSSILARASFETPIKHFVNATIQGSKDDLKSVIENVMLNQIIPVGTGLPGLLVKITGKLAPKGKKEKE